MSSIARRGNDRWRARYRDAAGKEHNKSFRRKVDAQRWLDEITTAIGTGTYVDPATARMTVREWCKLWMQGYKLNRAGTVKQARVHIKLIEAEFGDTPLSMVKPSDVKRWTARLKDEGYADSYVYATYRRLAQVMGDAAHDGIIPRSPCSRRVAPPQGEQRPYVATTEQIWKLHDLFPEHLRAAVLLGSFAGLRLGEAVGLRSSDVDFMRGIVTPAVQYPEEPLKTEYSRTPVPIPDDLALLLSACVALGEGEHVVTSEIGRRSTPWQVERAMRAHRKDAGLPEGFRFHDLRHYFASLLIGAGLDVKVVQTRLRHKSATTTLNTYGHLWPDNDETARAAVGSAVAARAANLRPTGES